MSKVRTWVVLSDGRYIKILINKGEGKALTILNADDLPAYAELGYLMVNGKPLNGTGDSAVSKKIDNIQCQVDSWQNTTSWTCLIYWQLRHQRMC